MPLKNTGSNWKIFEKPLKIGNPEVNNSENPLRQ
jgi:hypothetical protein